MPKVTINDALAALPSTPLAQGIIFQNTGESTAYWGWESNITADGANQGMPLPPGEWRSLSKRHFDLGSPLRFVCATGEETTINYTRNL